MIYNHPIGSISLIYHLYIACWGGLYATYHLLREPGNSIETRIVCRIYGLILPSCMGVIINEVEGSHRISIKQAV